MLKCIGLKAEDVNGNMSLIPREIFSGNQIKQNVMSRMCGK
jgi:hypothetical protein